MNSIAVFFIALCIIISNVVFAHFFAFHGIELTPIVIILITSIIVFSKSNIPAILQSFLPAFLIILHDIGLKLYTGGKHDAAGYAWLQLYSFIGLVPAYIIILIAISMNQHAVKNNKVIAALLFPVLITIHLLLTSDLGLGRYYPV